jgi:hypothetical protein
MRARQRFDHRMVNDYDQIEARLTFRFRLLSFESGYIQYRQSLLELSDYRRVRVYFRISRTFGIL